MRNRETDGEIAQVGRDETDKSAVLGMTPGVFQQQLLQANTVYDRIVHLGPFYGKDIRGQNPSFRVSAEPLGLPANLKDVYTQLGQDILFLAYALPCLPAEIRGSLGRDWSALVPFLWRVDSIIDADNRVFVNEVQISDGCDGRMTGLQLAYNLATPHESTPGHIINYLTKKYNSNYRSPRVAFIRHDITGSPYASNARRMHEFLVEAAGNKIDFSLTDKSELSSTDWRQFDGVINYAFVRVKDLLNSGITKDQILCPGDASYIGSKALFALLHDPRMTQFWQDSLKADTLQRLRSYFIKSNIVKDAGDIKNAKDSGYVVKVFDAPLLSTLGAARGVFGPWNLSDEMWQVAFAHLDQGSGLIVQEFIRPRRFPILLRSSNGKNLQWAEMHNKVAAKYVMTDPSSNNVALTGLEATLGESEKPAGKGCCITSVNFLSF